MTRRYLEKGMIEYMKKAVIVSAVRVGTGNYGGQWIPVEPYKLAAAVIREAVNRVKFDPAEIEDVIMGNLYGQHGNIARVAALEAGLPETSGAITIDRQCGSSLHAVFEAAAGIMAGNGEVYVACGLEHMTRQPYQLEKPSAAYQRVGPNSLPTQVTAKNSEEERMGITAETVAKRYGLTRQELDTFAYNSHKKAADATVRGVFKQHILPVELPGKKGATYMVDGDESIRADITMDALAKLKPAFQADGLVTAGNACPWSDGAAALVIMSENRARSLNIRPLATILSYAVCGLDPAVMGLGPVYAVPKALKRAGLTVKDLDVVELNEAFAAQSIPCIRELGLDETKVNPHGGAIALGHPLGATGAILTGKIAWDMTDRGLRHGLVTMCIGGGQGAALVLRKE